MDNKKPFISIIVSNWNSKDYLIPCLDSIFSSQYSNIEVLLIDDASTDNGPDIATHQYKDKKNFRIIQHEISHGLTAVFNEGFKISKGEYVVFMHSDTTVEKTWLDKLIEKMKDDTVGCCGGKFLSMTNNKIILGAGHKIDYFGYPVRNEYSGKINDGSYDMVEQTFDAWDACMMVKRKVLDIVGPFDEDFYYANEEIDLCWRINLAGYKVLYVPDCVIYHKSENISKNLTTNFAYQMSKNYMQAILKNYGTTNLIKYFPIIISLIIGRISIEFLHRKPDTGRAMICGLLWNFRNLTKILKKRKHIQKHIRKVDDREIMKLMLQPKLSFYISSLKPIQK